MDAMPVCHLSTAMEWEQEPAVDVVAGPWGGVQKPLPFSVTCALWGLATANLFVAGWAAALLSGALSCSGFLCTAATLGDRPLLLLILTTNGVAALLGAATVTGGLTRAGGAQQVVLVITAVVGVGAVLGVLLTLLLVAAAVTVLGCVLISVIENL